MCEWHFTAVVSDLVGTYFNHSIHCLIICLFVFDVFLMCF